MAKTIVQILKTIWEAAGPFFREDLVHILNGLRRLRPLIEGSLKSLNAESFFSNMILAFILVILLGGIAGLLVIPWMAYKLIQISRRKQALQNLRNLFRISRWAAWLTVITIPMLLFVLIVFGMIEETEPAKTSSSKILDVLMVSSAFYYCLVSAGLGALGYLHAKRKFAYACIADFIISPIIAIAYIWRSESEMRMYMDLTELLPGIIAAAILIRDPDWLGVRGRRIGILWLTTSVMMLLLIILLHLQNTLPLLVVFVLIMVNIIEMWRLALVAGVFRNVLEKIKQETLKPIQS